MDLILYMGSPFTAYLGQLLLCLGSDCLIAFKSTFLSIIGTYIIMILKFFMEEPRPFWANGDIKSTHCDLTFASPDRQAFNLMFFWLFVTYQYLWKYNSKPNKFVCGTVFSCIILLMFMNAFVRAYYGLIYIH